MSWNVTSEKRETYPLWTVPARPLGFVTVTS
jgi:hypothetical protein